MKKFLKTMLLGIRTVFLAFATTIFIAVGILELTKISNYSGYEAVYGFVMSLLAVIIGLGMLYVLGYMTED